MAKTNGNKPRAVVVCTSRRGVFFGYTEEDNEALMRPGRSVTLANARMVSYWSRETRGVLGLAAIGPQKGSRIGPRVSELTCESLTAVMVCSPEAVTAWESGTWT